MDIKDCKRGMKVKYYANFSGRFTDKCYIGTILLGASVDHHTCLVDFGSRMNNKLHNGNGVMHNGREIGTSGGEGNYWWANPLNLERYVPNCLEAVIKK